jgi:hypothetical protein
MAEKHYSAKKYFSLSLFLGEKLKQFYICAPFRRVHSCRNVNGPVAERLGSALQKLLLRFESARDLKVKAFR